MKRILSFAVLLAMVSSVAAPAGNTSASNASAVRASASNASASAITATPPVAATVPARAATRSVLILRADGLAVRSRSGLVRRLPFGASSARVTLEVKNILGAGRTWKNTENPECAGPRSTYLVKGFSLLLDGKKFVGWTDQGAPGRRLAAADGTGVGITLARLRVLHPKKITVFRSSLGPEFSHAGTGINGLLNGTRPTSRVTAVFAGETCFYR